MLIIIDTFFDKYFPLNVITGTSRRNFPEQDLLNIIEPIIIVTSNSHSQRKSIYFIIRSIKYVLRGLA